MNAIDAAIVAKGPDDAYEFEVCGSCLIALANDDYSSMETEEADAVATGLNRLHAEYGMVVPDGAEYGFCSNRCECCDGLPGDRFRIICTGAKS